MIKNFIGFYSGFHFGFLFIDLTDTLWYNYDHQMSDP